MATLYGVDTRTVKEHVTNIFKDSELDETSTIRNFRIVRSEGGRSITRNRDYETNCCECS